MVYHPPQDPDLPDDETPEAAAALEATVICPYCGVRNLLALDPGSGAVQDYIEDCQVCCQPCRVFVAYHADGSAEVEIEKAEEG